MISKAKAHVEAVGRLSRLLLELEKRGVVKKERIRKKGSCKERKNQKKRKSQREDLNKKIEIKIIRMKERNIMSFVSMVMRFNLIIQ